MTIYKHPKDKPLSRTVIYPDERLKQYRDGVLYVDTETKEDTKEVISVQLRYNGVNQILTPPFNVEHIKRIWNGANAVVMHNAPYDMGVLSTLPGNSWEWVTEVDTREDVNGEPMKFSFCRMKLFGCSYKVKQLNRHGNFIRLEGKGTPVIDNLKLFALFIKDKDVGLKTLAPEYLGREMIPYSRKNAETSEYQLQDVEALDGLWCVFEAARQEIDNVRDYTYDELMQLDSTATCAKKEYLKQYPEIRKWRDENDKEDEKFGLRNAVEQAFLGGFTCALHHGTVRGVIVEDIKGSYDAAIINENLDQYNRYTWEKIDIPEVIPEDGCPILCKVWTNVVMKNMEDSLKVFRVKQKKDMWMWSYDILALDNFIEGGVDIEVLEAYRLVPLNPVEESRARVWHGKKDWAEDKYGKEHPLRLYYKTMSNASYGICAQRRHGRTPYTNMPKAGITTSRGRLTLSKMVKVGREMGCKWLYSDTDSVVLELNGEDPCKVNRAINAAIYPYQCECEFIGDIMVSSLKRYLGYNGEDLKAEKVKDKIRVHGRGPYNIEEEDMVRMLKGEVINDELQISNLAATTEITMKMVMKVNPHITNPHPFMFETDIGKNITKHDWFRRYRLHCDAKMTVPVGATYEDEFDREFLEFETYNDAEEYFSKSKSNSLEETELIAIDDDEIDWDTEVKNTLPELYEEVIDGE